MIWFRCLPRSFLPPDTPSPPPQTDAAMVGLVLTVSSVVVAIIVSRIADRWFGCLKMLILCLVSLGTLFNTWLLLIVTGKLGDVGVCEYLLYILLVLLKPPLSTS